MEQRVRFLLNHASLQTKQVRECKFPLFSHMVERTFSLPRCSVLRPLVQPLQLWPVSSYLKKLKFSLFGDAPREECLDTVDPNATETEVDPEQAELDLRK